MEGKVTSITKFGAFVALDNGKSGLVHISEIANTFVNDVHDYLQEGQAVKVLVLSTENGKVNLSIKRTLPRPERPARSPRPSGSHPAGASRPVVKQKYILLKGKNIQLRIFSETVQVQALSLTRYETYV